MIFIGMLLLGCLTGFIGVGGSGLCIALLTVGYGIPIHTAIAVALSGMAFSVLSGTISHFREGDVLVRLGLVVGAFGVIGSIAGTRLALLMPPKVLVTGTAVLLILSTLLMYIKLYHPGITAGFAGEGTGEAMGVGFYVKAAAAGLANGLLAGTFGIGASAFIQLGLMLFFGISMYHAIGTTMLVILPIAVAGGLGYLASGQLDLNVFLQTLCGLSIGSFLGAKLTHLAPKPLLRVFMVMTPALGGIALLLRR